MLLAGPSASERQAPAMQCMVLRGASVHLGVKPQVRERALIRVLIIAIRVLIIAIMVLIIAVRVLIIAIRVLMIAVRVLIIAIRALPGCSEYSHGTRLHKLRRVLAVDRRVLAGRLLAAAPAPPTAQGVP